LLHLVTHGGYEPALGEIDDPLELADIALAGANSDGNAGMMTAAELMAVNLDGTDLVVLSACDTARGTASYAEGLAGLPSALAVAGARRSLLALWPVTDPGTAVFMRRFYEHLAATPGEYEAALRAAKLDVIAGRLALPNGAPDWKAFVMMRN
jgi:CHAT domain-containing protein